MIERENRTGAPGAIKDPLYRLTRADRTNPGATPPNQWTWGYDAVGNRTSAQKDQEATTSTHNEKNQLLQTSGGGKMLWRGVLDEPGTATFRAASASINGQPARMLAGNVFEATLDLPAGANTVTIHAEDGSGNWVDKSYSVNVLGVPATYTYDANGNLATKTEGADSWTYTWNALNQLTEVKKNTATVATYSYDPNGRRVVRVEGAISTDFTYNGLDIFREAINGTSTVKYVHGLGFDVPLTREESSGAFRYLHADAIGSILRETDNLGNPLAGRTYDAFGVSESPQGSGYGFTGREYDSATKLDYYRARYYDPQVGRFLSEDPIAFRGGVNFFAYVKNNPASRIDPLGLKGQGRQMPVRMCPAYRDHWGQVRNYYAYLCCVDGQPGMCVNADTWAKAGPRFKTCNAEHEGMHADDWEAAQEGCKPRCTGSGCAPLDWDRSEETRNKQHCRITQATYECFKGSGEQGPDGQDMTNESKIVMDMYCNWKPKP